MRGLTARALAREADVLWPAAAVAGAIALLAAADPLLRSIHVVTGRDPWAAWSLTPGISLATLLVAWLYVRGERGRGLAARDRAAALRHLAFFGGLAALFLALQSPIEWISDHLFVAHQVEHMLLRTIAPMLLMLAAPQATFVRALPATLRRRVLAPALGSPVVRTLAVFGHPAVATLLFIGTTYFWMIPRFHDFAILDESVHELWHTSLLVTGLIFFWRVLDPRPHPLGASLGVRLFMFWAAAIGNIALGAYLSFKDQVLYHAYDEMGRMGGLAAAADETYGGLTMWIMGTMMFVATAMIMIYRWAREEQRRAERGAGRGSAIKAAEAAARQRPGNRRMAVGLACFAATVLLVVFALVLVYHTASTGHGVAGLL